MKKINIRYFIYSVFAINLFLSSCEFFEKEDNLPNLKVIFSHEGGDYDEKIELELSCNEDSAEIWYTTDGSTNPEIDGEGSSLYTNPITIGQTTTIKAIAYLGDKSGDVYSETYTYETPVSAGFFSYYSGSFFEFIIKKEADASTGESLIWEVESYDETTGKATIIATKNGSEQTTIYMRQSTAGLEYSYNGSSWKYLVSTTESAGDLGFVYATKAADPSSLLGNVVNDTKITTVTTSAGSFDVFMHSSEYDNSSRDNYLYIDNNYEYFNQEIGFIKSYSHAYDGADYPPWVYHREIELIGYYIIKPDGSILQGGKSYDLDSPPDAPTELTGERTSGTNVELSWQDNSMNEDNFIIYRRTIDPENTSVSVSLPQVLDTIDRGSVSYIDKNLNTSMQYEYQIKAINKYGESDYSNKFIANIYGVPEAPWDLSINYNDNLNYIFILCWARYSDNIDHFIVAYYSDGAWGDLSSEFDSNPDDVFNDKWLESLFIYYNGGEEFPSGTYKFKVKAVNSYGESLYSEEVEITL